MHIDRRPDGPARRCPLTVTLLRHGRLGWSRAYLVEDDSLALVDTGLPWHARKILDYIRSIGRKPEELRLILITHSHPDHTTGALARIHRGRAFG